MVAMDESGSIAPGQHAWMMRTIGEFRHAMDFRDRLAIVGFGRDARLLAPLNEPGRAGSGSEASDVDPKRNGHKVGALHDCAAGVFPDTVMKNGWFCLSDGNGKPKATRLARSCPR